MSSFRRLIRTLGLITLLSSLHPAGLAVGIESATRLTAAPLRYGRVDFVVMLQARWENPYRASDVRLDLELTSPSGKPLVIPAYFERGESGESSAWRVRFAPREAGAYRGQFVLDNAGGRHRSDPLEFAVAPSAGRGFLHPAGNWIFRFDSGAPFRGIGENLGWESRAFDDSRHFKDLHENERYHYEYLVGTLAANGGNFFRTWMCAWNLPLEWNRVSDTTRYTDDLEHHFNASAIRRMDELVELAAATNTYFMLVLDPHGSLLDGGWEKNPYNAKNGGPAKTPADFFTDPAARARYQDRLRYLVARWGYSPHLAIWEFFNEVDNAMYGQKPRIPDEPVRAWHAEMSAYLKALDPYERPITTSVSHRDVAGLATLPSLDFNQRHIYRATDTIPETIRRWSRETGKPYVIGEYGFEWDWTKNFNDFAPEMDADFKRGLWLGLFSPTPILPMTWWWEFFDQRGMPAYFARVRAVHEQMLAAGGGEYDEISPKWEGAAKPAHLLGVRCGKTTFVLLQNPSDETLSGQLRLPLVMSAARFRVEGLTPDTERTHPRLVAPTDESLVIPANVPPNESLILTIRPEE